MTSINNRKSDKTVISTWSYFYDRDNRLIEAEKDGGDTAIGSQLSFRQKEQDNQFRVRPVKNLLF